MAIASVIGLIAIAAAIGVAITINTKHYSGAINALQLDLSAPNAYLSTPALSRLPRDLVKAPYARELLTEQFAFYYEEHEERLSIAGFAKRFAFDHDTTALDQLVALVLDEPAEIALWTDGKGAPRYWMMAMTRGALAKLAQNAASLMAGDGQLSAIGELPGAFGSSGTSGSTQVLALVISSRRTYAIVTRGNRVVVLSDPGMLFDAERKADAASAKVVDALLSGDEREQSVLRRGFGLEANATDHVLVADSSLLSFGYRHFFPGLRGLRLAVSPGGAAMHMQLRVADAKALPDPATGNLLWTGMPMGAAACSWLPADWLRVRAVLAGVGDPLPEEAAGSAPTASRPVAASASTSASDPAAAPMPVQSAESKALWDRFAASFDGPAAICWYAGSQMHTPLLIAHLRPGTNGQATDDALARLARWMLQGDVAVLPPEDGEGRPTGNAAPARRWQSETLAPYGFYTESDSDENSDKETRSDGANGADKGSDQGASFYRSTFARSGDWVSFSPDDALVDLAMATQTRRYPSIASQLPDASATLAIVAPAPLADLLQRETDAVLPAGKELLRQAAQSRLTPRFATLRQWPAVQARTTGKPSAEGWIDVDWQPVDKAAAAVDTPASAPKRR